MSEYGSLFDTNLSSLPDEALKSIHWAVRKELNARKMARYGETMKSMDFLPSHIQPMQAHPNERHKFNRHHLWYLNILLDQDWSELFTGSQERKFYVYAHHFEKGRQVRFVDERVHISLPGLPFYIGKGTGDRAYDLKRNQGHGKQIKALVDSGSAKDSIVKILKSGLTEPEALELESKLIYFFGTQYEPGRKGLLLNLDIPARPTLVKMKRAKTNTKTQ